MLEDGVKIASDVPRRGLKTVPGARRVLQGPLQEAKLLPKPDSNQYVVHSRLLASDCPRKPQDGPKTDPRAPKNAPQARQEGPK
eukprot:9471708-Pyramimonas_sp.AAC.1